MNGLFFHYGIYFVPVNTYEKKWENEWVGLKLAIEEACILENVSFDIW